MRIDIRADVEHLAAGFGQMQREQIPFALMKTINQMLLFIQQSQREAQDKSFTIRRKDFARMAVKIDRQGFATKLQLVGRVGYQGPMGDVFAKFERGGPKVSPSGRPVWTPVGARRSKADIITKGNRPKGLNLKPSFTSLATGATIYRGDKRTFMIRYRDGSGLVLQRTGRRLRGRTRRGQSGRTSGRERAGTKTLFVYFKRPPLLPASLTFVLRAQQVINTTFATTFTAELDAAMKTAIPRRRGA